MTDKELRGLKRADLLEILFRLQTEVESLRAENASLQQRLQENLTVSLNDAQMQMLLTTVQQTISGISGGTAHE